MKKRQINQKRASFRGMARAAAVWFRMARTAGGMAL